MGSKHKNLKTHCKYGHIFDELNTRYKTRGRRKCLKCHARQMRERYCNLSLEQKQCIATRAKQWANKNPAANTRHRLKHYLKKHYGLTPDQLQLLQQTQTYRCYLCNDKTNLVVDHDHLTGKVRSLLCQHCNSGLGFFRDRADLLRKAADYCDDHAGPQP